MKFRRKIAWGGTNSDQSNAFVLINLKDPEQIQSFSQKEDVAKIRTEGGEDVASTIVISPIGEYYMLS